MEDVLAIEVLMDMNALIVEALMKMEALKVLKHASRTLPRLPYTNLKKSRTEKNPDY